MSGFDVNYGMGQIILDRAALTPKNTALIFCGEKTDFESFATRIRRVASLLREKGICRGDRVGLIAQNHPSFLEILYACSCLGAIFVPLNFRLSAPEVAFIVKDAGAKLIFADDACLPLIEEERANLSCAEFIATQTAHNGWQSYETLVADATPLSDVAYAGR